MITETTSKLVTYLLSAFFLIMSLVLVWDERMQEAIYFTLVSVVFMLMAIQATIEEKRKND